MAASRRRRDSDRPKAAQKMPGGGMPQGQEVRQQLQIAGPPKREGVLFSALP